MDPATLSKVFTMLLTMGVCGHADFKKSDGTSLTVISCPIERPAATDDDDTPPPAHGRPLPEQPGDKHT